MIRFILLLSILTAPSLDALRLDGLGTAAREAGQMALAEQYFADALAADEDYLPAMIHLGQARRSRGHPLDAALQFARAYRRQPGSAEAVSALEELILDAAKAHPDAESAVRVLRLIGDLAVREDWQHFRLALDQARGERLRAIVTEKPASAARQLAELLAMAPLTATEAVQLGQGLQDTSSELAAALLPVLDPGTDRIAPLQALLALQLAERRGESGRLARLRPQLRQLPLDNPDLTRLANRLTDLPASDVREIQEILARIQAGEYFRADLRLKEMKGRQGPVAAWRWLAALLASRQGKRQGARDLMGGLDPETVDDPLVLEGAGTLLAHIGMKELALRCFIRGGELYPDEPEFHLKAALLLEAAGRLDDAEDRLARALSLRPWSVRLKYFAYRLLRRRGETDTAERLAAEVLAEDPDGRYSSYIRLDRGANPSDVLVVESDWQLERWLAQDTDEILAPDALRRLAGEAVRRPAEPRLLARLRDHRRRKGDHLKALGYELLRGRERSLNPLELEERLELWLAAGFPAEAEHECRRLRGSHPRPAQLDLFLARVLHVRGQTTQAVQLLQTLQNDAADVAAAAQARQWLRSGLPDLPATGDPAPRLRLARFLLLHGARGLALPLLRDAGRAGDTEAVLLLQETLATEHRVDDALAELEGFSRSFGPDAEVLGAMGDLCHRVASWTRGIDYLLRARKLAPLDRQRQIRLAEMMEKSGRLEDAILEYQVILTRTPPGTERAEIRTRLGRLRRRVRQEGTRR